MSKSIIGALRVSLGIDSAQFSKGLKDSTSRMRRWGATVAKVGAGISVASTGVALAIRSQLNAADEMSKAAQTLGVPIKELSALRHAADLSGVSTTELDAALSKMARTMDDAAQGGKASQKVFQRLGVEYQNADGSLRPMSELMGDVAEQLGKMPDGAEKTALAMQIFGKSGAALIPMLNGGRAGLQGMIDEARELGLVIDEKTGKAAEQFNDNLSRLAKTVRGIAIQAMAALAPVLVQITDRVVELSKWFRDLSPGMQQAIGVIAGVTVVAGPLAVALGAVLMVAAPLAAAIAAVVSPVGLAVAGFVALGVAAGYVASRWDDIAAANPGVVEGVNRLAAPFAAVKTAVDEVAIRAIPALLDAGRSVAALFRGEFSAAGDLAGGAVRRLFGDLVALNGQLGEGIVNSIRAQWSGLSAVFSDAMAAGLSAVQSGWESIAATVSGWGEQFKQYGRDIVEGLRLGIAEKWDSMTGWFSKQVDDLVAILPFKTRMRSPSRLFKEFGGYITEGLAIGIEGGLPAAAQAMTAVSDALIGAGDGMAARFVTFRDMLQGTFAGLVTGALSFKDALRQVASSLAKMAAEQAFQSIFSGAFKTGSGGGFLGKLFGGLFGGKIASFDGGGFTGMGARTGGLDGKGGRLAMLHPQETVIDHTKGQGGRDLRVSVGFDGTMGAFVSRVFDATGRQIAQGMEVVQSEMLPAASGSRFRGRK